MIRVQSLLKQDARQNAGMSMADETDPITHATALLSTLMHCREQARELQACRRGSGNGATDCSNREAAFITCSEAHVGMVVQTLVKIADQHCPDEVKSVRQCRMICRGGCDAEDAAAMRCASLRVLHAHAADSR